MVGVDKRGAEVDHPRLGSIGELVLSVGVLAGPRGPLGLVGLRLLEVDEYGKEAREDVVIDKLVVGPALRSADDKVVGRLP